MTSPRSQRPFACFLLLLVPMTAMAAAAPDEKPRPNIVLILADDKY